MVHSNKTIIDNKICLIKCKFIHYLKQFNSCCLQYQGASFKNTFIAPQQFIHEWDNSLENQILQCSGKLLHLIIIYDNLIISKFNYLQYLSIYSYVHHIEVLQTLIKKKKLPNSKNLLDFR